VLQKSQRIIGDWLVHCSDPLGAATQPPRRPLTKDEAQELVAHADLHGILPILIRQFLPLQADATFVGIKEDALIKLRSALAFSLMLRSHGEAIMSAAAPLPVMMIKGPVFSRTIYPMPRLRTFTDIDLLIAPEAEPQLARILDEAGFRLAEYDRDPNRQEWKWLHREDAALMIEVHTNLVHHPELRSAVSVNFEDLGGDAETPEALLTTALVHGALHRFDRLRHLVDICQAARNLRTEAEEARLERMLQRTGARFAAIAGLDLAYRVFAERRCRDIASALGPPRHMSLVRALLRRSVVTSSMRSARNLHSWRRQAFRHLLKRSRYY
jgi:hypothetical protein